MAKQLAKALEPYRPLFIEVSEAVICIDNDANICVTPGANFVRTSLRVCL